jgi:hypothetical protein
MQPGTVTQGEQMVLLDGRLAEQLAKFDGMLLEERAAAAARQRDSGTLGADEDESGSDSGAGVDGGSGNGAGDGGDMGDGGGMAGAGGDGDTAPPLTGGAGGRGGRVSNSAGGGMPDMPAPPRTGDHPPMAVAAVPPDIPRGNDDDVVARQLREAAVQEPDPVLRAKLWNEYRKYKGMPVK